MKKFFLYTVVLSTVIVVLPLVSKAQCTFTSNAPYYEGFSGVTTSSPLPQCWVVSNTVTCFGVPSGSYASFYTNPAGTSYFLTNGIQLYTGVTYSISVKYNSGSSSPANWADFSLMLGANQASVGLTSLVSTNGPAVAAVFTDLSNTFVVNTSGIYYVAIRGVSSSASGSQYLSFDDLSITIPCSLNSVNVSAVASPTSVCVGQSVTLTASGADTYIWNTGDTTTVLTVTAGTTNYIVSGTNTLTGCTGSASPALIINPKPAVNIFAPNAVVCRGGGVNLFAYGAATYSWSTGATSGSITVTPSVTTLYSVTGINSAGCTGNASKEVTVNPVPVINVTSSHTYICEGEDVILTADGAVTYTWSTPGGALTGTTVTVTLNSGTTYAIIGTGANGCVGSYQLTLNISDCSGFSEIKGALQQVSVFPNPAENFITIALQGRENFLIEIYDVLGRLTLSKYCINSATLNIEKLSKGMYYLKVVSTVGATELRVVKH